MLLAAFGFCLLAASPASSRSLTATVARPPAMVISGSLGAAQRASRAILEKVPVGPLLEESPPLERRVRVIVRDALRDFRRAFKYSVYLVTNSPTWWWRRVKRLFWPVVFAAAGLFFDTGLLVAWKNDGVRVLATYVPMMLYVYARLFVSAGASVLARIGVVAALFYGVWRHDLIVEGRWSSLGIGRLDDFVIIVAAVRVFVATCPRELVDHYAQRAIAIRNRVSRAAPTQTP